MNLLKMLFVYPWCEHEYRHVTTIHGDERNHGMLSYWECSHCGKHRYSDRFYTLEDKRKNQWWVK